MLDVQMSSPEVSELFTALSKAQATMGRSLKDSSNPYFKSKYADLTSVWEACEEPLTRNGLSVTQVMQPINGQNCLISILAHASGQWIKSILPIKPAKEDIQSLGSAITYCRRYALAALVGVCPEDDDGEKAMDRKYNAEEIVKKYKDVPCELVLPSEVNKEEFDEYLKYVQEQKKKFSINQIRNMAAKDIDTFVAAFQKHKEKKKEIESVVGAFEAFSEEREGQ